MALFDKATLKKLKQKATEVINRGIDQHITIAVTGLSRSGKTAFITSLVNQLLNEGEGTHLSFFKPVQQERFIAAKRVPQQHLHIPRFDYEKSMSSFSESPPKWPEPTKGISELRLAIRYQPKNSILKYATDSATLYIDIADYPGEWLLDLPMLNQTYEQWSEQMASLLLQEPRLTHAQPFLAKLADIDVFAVADEEQLAELSQQYTELLEYFRHQLGLSVIQPGRFILPGEYADAPILQFFPFPNIATLDANQYQNAADDSFIGMLRARFVEYKERVVKQFYKEHFSRFDRQIILADCLSALNHGPENFADLQLAISLIMESFDYGKSSVFNRLFSPKIDKLLFAATKADHVTAEQHSRLVALLNQLVHQAKVDLNYESVAMKTLALASVQATKAGKSQYQGKEIAVLQGRQLSDEKLITLFPGSVPNKLPHKDNWPAQGFNYVAFAPLQTIASHEALPHLRMDQVMQFLLGDKML
ncbi:YcjX family protein [Thalassotalea agariperforans]